MTEKKALLIVFSSGHWESCKVHRYISEELSKDYLVLYVGSIGMRGLARPSRNNVWSVFQRIRTIFKNSLTYEENVWVLRPKAIVGVELNSISKIGNAVIKKQITSALKKLQFERSKILLGTPNALSLACNFCSPRDMTYFPVDDYSAFEWISSEDILSMERNIVEQGIPVISPSKELCARFASWGAKTQVIRQGVHWDLFALALEDHYSSPQREWIHYLEWPGKIVTLFGNLDGRIDVDYLKQLAIQMPDVLFLMVGPITHEKLHLLKAVSNIRFTGEVQYQDLPYILWKSSACMVPYMRNKLTYAMQPLKILEYLAAGRAVIGTELPALEGFPSDDVLVTNSTSKAAAYLYAVFEEPLEKKRLRSLSMKRHTWNNRAYQIKNIMERF